MNKHLKKLYTFFRNLYFTITDDFIFPLLQTLTNGIFLVYRKFNKGNGGRTLILTQDRIGDCIIRMALLEKYSCYFKDIYFLISKENYDLFRNLSDKLIILDNKKMNRNFIYRWKFISKINFLNFDNIVFSVPMNALDNNKIFNRFLISENKFYNEDKCDTKYVLDEQVKLFNNITGQNIKVSEIKTDLTKYLPDKKFNIDHKLFDEDYIVINMGAHDKGRMYPLDKFEIVFQYLLQMGEKIVFLGRGKNDSEYFEGLMKTAKGNSGKVINLIDKLSLPESLFVIKNSKMFIGVESGLWNASYSLNIPSVVIYGGGHFGRFMHQDESIGYVYKKMDCYKCKWNCRYVDVNVESAKCISDIEPEKIIDSIRKKWNKEIVYESK